MIKIKVTKQVNRGRRFYHITEIVAPTQDELPYEYIEGKPATWLDRNALVIYDDKEWVGQLNLGGVYNASEFEKRWALVEEGVKRLSKVIKDQDDLNKDWQGDTVFIANAEK